eukprot:jgi/Mesvir1/22206/Mv18801-RA.1
MDRRILHPVYAHYMHGPARSFNNCAIIKICVTDEDHDIAKKDSGWTGPLGEVEVWDEEDSDIPCLWEVTGVHTVFLDYRQVNGYLKRRKGVKGVLLEPAVYVNDGDHVSFDYAVMGAILHMNRRKLEYPCDLFAVMRKHGIKTLDPAEVSNQCRELMRQLVFASQGHVEIRGARHLVLGSYGAFGAEDLLKQVDGNRAIRFFFPPSTCLSTTTRVMEQLLDGRVKHGSGCQLVLYGHEAPNALMESVMSGPFRDLVLVGFDGLEVKVPSSTITLFPVDDRPQDQAILRVSRVVRSLVVYLPPGVNLRVGVSEVVSAITIDRDGAEDRFPPILKFLFV